MTKALIIDLGIMDYRECLALQHDVHLARIESRLPDCLLLVEHPHVMTLGKNGNRSNILVSDSDLKSKNVDTVSIERGGDVTYHGPGQVVIYPIFSLRGRRYGVTELVSSMEEVMILTLKDFGIKGERNKQNRGVWVGKEKMGFIGIAVRRGVVLHGLSFNVAPDLSFFNMIHSCGLKGVNVTSMKTLMNKDIGLEDVKASLVSHFQQIMNLDIEEMNKGNLLARLSNISPFESAGCS